MSGRLVCWSLAAAMVTAGVDAVLDPRAGWWGAVWSLPWWIFGAAVLMWGVLRSREKADRRPPHDSVRSHWERAA
ncbi:hypothetical protein [Streptomyces caelestis]|jgi:hypothetical protein|uniref:Uncharacterized protein n=1 Tax=Streptomyces caelestis TaxID=36816 RepID=A0A7W9H3X5_9ACTN|nr:hypothetical protein [Streptomyces caelestis]MBB5794971.1 hypothetical protein [Streptomyces caelestis]